MCWSGEEKVIIITYAFLLWKINASITNEWVKEEIDLFVEIIQNKPTSGIWDGVCLEYGTEYASVKLRCNGFLYIFFSEKL